MHGHADPSYVAGLVHSIRFAALAMGFAVSALFLATL